MKEIKLRPGQEEVCAYRGGLLGVPSVPGAGKTFTLAMLTANLIQEERHLPGKILIVTYMNSAASNFRNRIGDLLEERGLPRNKGFEVMTIHSLAMKIIKEKPEDLYLPEDFIPLDEIEQYRIIQRETSHWIQNNAQAFKRFLDLGENDKSGVVKKKIDQWTVKVNLVVKEMISFLKCQRVELGKLPQFLKDVSEDSILRMCLEIYEQYERALRYMGIMDFDDLIVKSIELLNKNQEVRNKLQNRYTYIFEDEAQDSSILQEELLLLLSEQYQNLVRVGDSNQSIMSTFTVSDPKLFKRYCERPDTQVERILVSSRSSNDILDTANFLVEWAEEFHPVTGCRDSLERQIIAPVAEDDPFPNPIPQGYRIGKLLAKTRREELIKIGRSAAAQRDKNTTIAILLPTSHTMEEMKEILDKDNISYKEVSSFPKDRTKVTEILGSILDFIAYPYDNERFTHLIAQHLCEEILEDGKLMEYLSRCSLEELFYPLEEQSNSETWREEIQKNFLWPLLNENIEMLKQFLEMASLEPEALVLYMAECLHFTEEQMAIAQKIASDIRYMMLLNPSWRLGELAQQLKSIRNGYNYFANLVYDRKGFQAEPGVINLITYHKSKGLEFDTVYLTCLVSEEFPAKLEDKFKSDYWFLKQEYKNPVAIAKAELEKHLHQESTLSPIDKSRMDTIQERLRLLYVGITRARENLLISTHESYESEFGKKNTTPSLYFHALKDYIEGKRKDV